MALFPMVTGGGTARKEYMIYGDASSGFTAGVYFRAEDLKGFATANLTFVSGNLSYYFYKKDNGDNTRFTSPLNITSLGSFNTLVIGAGASGSIRAKIELS